EGCRVRARQHRQRSKTLGVAVGDQPRKAATRIVTNQVKPTLAMPGRRDDVERVADQAVDTIIIDVSWIGAGIARIATLVWRDREVARLRQCRQLVVPEMA